MSGLGVGGAAVGAPPQTQLGLRPRPRWGLPPPNPRLGGPPPPDPPHRMPGPDPGGGGARVRGPPLSGILSEIFLKFIDQKHEEMHAYQG